MSEQEKLDMSRYVASLSLEDTKGLGVVTTGHILTSANYFPGVCINTETWFEVSGNIIGQDPLDYYVQTLDTMMDFMVLGDNPLNVEVDDEEQAPIWDMEPDIKPVELVFPEDTGCVEVPVYFFLSDGKTTVHATAEVYRWGHIIRIKGSIGSLDNGFNGGPVFTEDHQLIGIVQGYYHDNGRTLWVRAIRIDLAATGWLRQEMGGFEQYRLENSAPVSCDEQTADV